ncbi:ribosome maturation factor RimP [Candidatus Synechococcus calcipolaris G9]|uniref:Ribosome maturation factor RimP n=1 Tax=Candidatus Synechococcus calcipolaris G9 TaxID=1497997 RepID=A0ABT6EUK3_9SYNE|nr:ribosome maturation factor RimP [Candidatus Synechococcus calcipolaris]MDG2989530.1 ribosome maturation factor RimP [Candidatus Synechococcus calcipolaris G9]
MADSFLLPIEDLARSLAADLGLELVAIHFHRHHHPPTLRVDVRHPTLDTGLEDCEQMSRNLETCLDEQDLIPGNYVLEVSSPGLSDVLQSDLDFTVFRGFPILITTAEPFRGKTAWEGTLIRRDEDAVYLNQKGRTITIARSLVTQVQLQTPSSE